MSTTDKRPLKVFLCHAHADRDAVRALYARLTNDGVDAWLDKEKLLPGQDWELEIKKAVREADVVVVCLSKQFNQAGFRQKEVRLALDTAMEKPEGEIFIIPARLEDCENLESLRKWHRVDLFEDDGYKMLMRALHVRSDTIGVMFNLESYLPSKSHNVNVEFKETLGGRYRILDKIGVGGMTTVYKVFDFYLNRDVTVKIVRWEHIPPNVLEKTLSRFEREVGALAKLTHPNVATVIDYGKHNGMPYLVMPYLSGGTLKQRMGKPMPWREAIQLLLPIALALEYVHSVGIVHRDLKPSNILFTQSGQPILTDLGISMLFNLGNTEEFMTASSGIGTPEYMAPEIIRGQSDYRVDIYALGVILYEMLTGSKPFTGDTPMVVFMKKLSEPLLSPKVIIPGLPGKVETVLLKALAKNPDDRYADMSSFILDMQGLLSQDSVFRRLFKFR